MTNAVPMTGREGLERALQDLASTGEQAQEWVSSKSELDRTSQRLMGDLVQGDQVCIDACMAWLEGCEHHLPVTVRPGPTPHSWRLDIDAASAADLPTHDVQMLAAMDALLFGGPPCRTDNPHWDRLRSMGLPSGLRADIDA